MILPWSTILFAAVTLIVAIIVSILLSITFGIGIGQILGPVITWIVLVYGYHKRREDRDGPESATGEDTGKDTTDQRDIEYQLQAYSLDNDSNTDSADSTDNTCEPLNRSGLRYSNGKILEETGNKLDGYVTLKDDGTIELDGDDLDLYRRLMLYIVAKRIAYEDNFVETPEVTLDDINGCRDLNYNKIEILLFLREVRNWLVPLDDQDLSVSTIDYADLNDAAFTVKTRSLSDIADWILEDPLPATTPFDISSQLSNAGAALSEARNHYDKIRKDEAENNRYSAEKRYSSVREEILLACKKIDHYPIIFERDHVWTEFTKYAEALLDFFDDDMCIKTEHCLPWMQRYQKQMKETADDASYI